MDLKSTEGMYESILALGKMLGKEEEAEKLHQEFEDFKNDFAQKHNEQEAPTVLILMGLPGSYVVATESSYVGSLVKLAGGVNVYGDGNGQDFLNINPEDMVEKAPDIILRTSHALPEQVKKCLRKSLRRMIFGNILRRCKMREYMTWIMKSLG